MFRGNNNDCRVYVGNLPEDCRERDVEDIFYKYGGIADIRIKTSDSRGRDSRDRRDRGGNLSYAFVQFDDPRDAEDAVRARDGYEFDGNRLRVEFTRGAQNNFRQGGGGGGSRFQGRGRGRGQPPKRSNYRVHVRGLPPTGSWQDLKDHMRVAGEVLYAEVYGDGSGIVEFADHDDVKYAMKNLNDTDFRSHEGETSRLTVADDHGGSSKRGRSYSRSRSRSRSRSYSRGRKSRSRSKSKSRSRSASKSPPPRSRSSPARSKSPPPRTRSPPRRSRSRSSSHSPRRSPQ